MIESCADTQVESPIKPQLDVRWLGLCPYAEALQQMKAAWDVVKDQDPARIVLLGCEHPLVYTLGRRASIQDLLFQDLPFVQTDRGGQVTLHSPGQLVIYPIVNLAYWKLGVRDFVALLLETTEATLKTWGVDSQRVDSAGLTTTEGKIAFLGLRVDRGVTRHGLSLNISNDLSHFQSIVPCGQRGASIDRLQRVLDPAPSVELAFKSWQGELKLILPSAIFKGSVGAVGSAFP